MTPKSGKAKGRRLQDWVVDRIRTLYQCHPDDCRPAIMGESGVDIKLSPAMQERFPYALECKNTERIAIWQALEQCETNAKKTGLRPLLVFSRNRSPTYAVVRFDEFMALVREEGKA